MVDLQHKIHALHVVWVRHLWVHHGQPSVFFFQHYLQVSFNVCTVDQVLLLAAPSPTALSLLPPFYRSVMTSWFLLPRHLENGEIVVGSVASPCCPLRSLTTRFTYRELSRLDAPEHRTVGKYSSWGLTVEWNTVWRNLSLWQFIRPIRDTNWLIAHGILPTVDRLLRFHIDVEPLCHCGQPESLLHLFIECPLQNAWWPGTSSWFTVLSPKSVAHPLRRSSLATSSPSGSHPLSRVFLESSVIAYGSPATVGVLTRFPSSSALCSILRFVLRTYHRNLPVDLFTESWLAGGVFGYVSSDNDIVFRDDFT